jgi:spore germination protein GerM
MRLALVVPTLVLAASLGFLIASCASDGDATPAGPVPAVDTTTGSTSDEVPATTEETPTETGETETGGETDTGGETETGAVVDTVSYEVWFANKDGLFVTYRTEGATPRVGTAALEELLEGPSPFEEAYGLRSAVPEGTQLLGLRIEDGLAYVDLTSEFESGGGTASMQMRLAQVVFTITQFPTVKGVVFSLDGEQIDVLGGEGIIIDHPLTRRDYAELLPPILVVSPTFGEELLGSVLVRGSANVFEANVTVAVLDESGSEVGGTFTTATCGTGCRGTYKVRVPFDVDEAQDGTIVVHDDDAAGIGRPPNEVRIPVRLLPGS